MGDDARSMTRGWPAAAVVGLVLFSFSAFAPKTAYSGSIEVVTDEPATDAGGAADSSALPLPQPLSAEDAERYRRIFELQHDGDWQAADAEIAQLQNRLLVGHVLAQRLLHPKQYRASFDELKDWLAEYSDHPEAIQVYALATQRKPKGAEAPERPDGSFLSGLGADIGVLGEEPPRNAPALSDAESAKAQKLKAKVRAHIRSGWPTGAKALIETDDAHRLLGPVEYDELRADIAASYFAYGKDSEALAMAEEAAAHSGGKVPAAHWTAGIAAWRLGDPEGAIRHFEAVAKSPYASKWDVAAAAFWAARANLVTRRPKDVSHWLAVAAEQGRSFYGILARRWLGQPDDLNWQAPVLDEAGLESIAAIPAAQRAFALLQVDQGDRAEDELRKIYATADPDLANTILALSLHGEFPGLAMRIGVQVARETGEVMDAALYPVPSWQPSRGYSVDRSLLFAVIRQESRFDAGAQSHAGARGLMQIMPATARFLAANGDGAADDAEEDGYELFDPVSNISLGQRYLVHLLEDSSVQGNLFMLAAAYNAGPAKVAEWRRKIDDGGDPLLFIESIPSRETRGFVERVIANMWVYQQRLGQPSPSLDAVVAGDWPEYAGQDVRHLNVAGNDGD